MADDQDALEARRTVLLRAEARGHDLGWWYVVDKRRAHASGCRLCGRLAWIDKPDGEKRWKLGGSALEADCEGGFRT